MAHRSPALKCRRSLVYKHPVSVFVWWSRSMNGRVRLLKRIRVSVELRAETVSLDLRYEEAKWMNNTMSWPSQVPIAATAEYVTELKVSRTDRQVFDWHHNTLLEDLVNARHSAQVVHVFHWGRMRIFLQLVQHKMWKWEISMSPKIEREIIRQGNGWRITPFPWPHGQEPVSELLSLLFQWQFQLRWDQTRCINYCKGWTMRLWRIGIGIAVYL